MDMAGSELDFFKQKVSQLTTDLSRTLENLNGLMETNADNIAGTLGNLNSVTGDMAEILSAEKNSLKSALDNLSKFSDMLGENAGRVDSIIGDVDRFTSQLTEEQFARKLSQAVEHLDGLVACIAQGEGTIGKLISDPELYDSLGKGQRQPRGAAGRCQTIPRPLRPPLALRAQPRKDEGACRQEGRQGCCQG